MEVISQERTRIADLLKKKSIINLNRKLINDFLKTEAPQYKRAKYSGLNEARFTDIFEQMKRKSAHNIFERELKLFYKSVPKYQEYREYFRSKHKRMFSECVNQIPLHSFNTEAKQIEIVDNTETERLRCLMTKDEVGYRKLIDEKKNKRLASLLAQTDEYLGNLMQMVRRHKHAQVTGKPVESYTALSRRKYELLLSGEYANLSDGCEVGEERVAVRNSADNAILKGNHAPKLKNLHQWLLKNPGWTWDATDAVWDELTEYEGDKIVAVVGKTTQEDTYYSIAHSIKEKIYQQPNMLANGTLKGYQLKGLEWLVSLYNNKLNGILADEMGLGKTIQTIALVTYLMEQKKQMGPYLIIVPLSTLNNWQKEFDAWAPGVQVISYKGNLKNRRQMHSILYELDFNVMLTTYEYIIKDKAALAKVQWIYLIVDEGHRIKNKDCRLTYILNTCYNRSAHRLLLTGTPLQNKLPELWALLNFLLPTIFKSCASFEAWFNAPFAAVGENVELNEEETILIIRRLHKVLRPFLLRRLKKEVEHQLPQKVEHIIRCEMSALQRLLYKNMQSKGMMLTDGSEQGRSGRGGVKALMNTIVQLRKICNHPFIYNHIEDSFAKHKRDKVTGVDLYRVAGKFELLDRILPKLKVTNHRVLLFCQMTQCLSILEDYLLFRNLEYLRLDGSTKAEERGQLLTQFNDPNSNYFLFLLSTRAGGLGLNLQTADTVIIFDSDWNPHQDLQAQDRAHRIGQRNEVRVLRLITVNSVEERILSAARYKLSLDEKVIQAGMFNQNSTDVERRNFLQCVLHQNEIDEEELSIPTDNDLNLMLARNEVELRVFADIDNKYKHNCIQELGQVNRLIMESELPLWLTANEKMRQEDSCKAITQLGKTRLSTRLSLSQIAATPAIAKVEKMDDELSESSDDYAAPSAEKQLQVLLHTILKKIISFHNEDGHNVSEMFINLPSKSSLPDYYKLIEHPIDINKIQTKINAKLYKSVDQMEQDFMLMCKNAQVYNENESQVYRDAVALEGLFKSARNDVLCPATKKVKRANNKAGKRKRCTKN